MEAFTDLETVEAVNAYAGREPDLVRRITRLRRDPGQRIDHPLFQRAVETVQAQELTELVEGRRVLTFFGPLRNREPCQQCHEPNHEVRGVVRISLGLKALDAEVARARNRQLVVAGLTILGVAASIVVFLGHVPPVAIHVGINSGPALVGTTKLDTGGGGRWTFTASGPTTNLAARVAGLTRGGEVKIGPETAARIQDHYVLQDTGEHQLKNVSQLVRIYRLVPAGIYMRIE